MQFGPSTWTTLAVQLWKNTLLTSADISFNSYTLSNVAPFANIRRQPSTFKHKGCGFLPFTPVLSQLGYHSLLYSNKRTYMSYGTAKRFRNCLHTWTFIIIIYIIINMNSLSTSTVWTWNAFLLQHFPPSAQLSLKSNNVKSNNTIKWKI